jgi:prolipoprotein diacylglyceryltransferase
MIFSKGISIFLSGLFFLFLALLFSAISVTFLKGGLIPVIGLVMFVIFYFITRMFYSYLRNDDKYKNSRSVSSDKPGEKYYTKGERDPKKLFVVAWLIVILILTSASLWLYSFNNGLV